MDRVRIDLNHDLHKKNNEQKNHDINLKKS